MKRCLVLVAAFACGPKPATSTEPAPAPDTLSNTVESDGTDANLPAGLTDGALWTCQIDIYDPLPCRFSTENGAWTLRKLLGSQRFEGTVTFPPDAIEFDGRFFCPGGDCTMPMVTTFADQGGGQYATTFDGAPIVLVWDEAYASEWGGAGYGGLTADEL